MNQTKKVDFINIDCDDSYYDTRRQIDARNIQYFTDKSSSSKISGSNTAINLLSEKIVSRKKIKENSNSYPLALSNSPVYPTGSTVKDSSNNDRKILSLEVDPTVSSSVDAYKHGVELLREKDWQSGFVKISAGTPGHLFDPARWGVPRLAILESDEFLEIEVFDPVKFVETGGDDSIFTHPIVTSDRNLAENLVQDGIIEPFPIRPVIANFSVNFPFEPRAFRASMESGNQNKVFSSDRVLSADYFEPDRVNRAFFLDASDTLVFTDEYGTKTTIPGVNIDFFNMDENYLRPFEDYVPPRGRAINSTYSGILSGTIERMPAGGTTYVSRKEKSATCGFFYENAESGTDSIAFGGLLY